MPWMLRAWPGGARATPAGSVVGPQRAGLWASSDRPARPMAAKCGPNAPLIATTARPVLAIVATLLSAEFGLPLWLAADLGCCRG
ncbi:hypothetical protein [Aquabacterium sp. OR-4]|uniref:hypothetical protein n=1 Tax=Aquabacterium sp. OR-4 TaxID=2978127 RepID=UPI0021B321EF|nr:hypothetical protein [Aquabacterium sp. OR-4]MDT7835094.1 hypothetical protein [Aquabacterium sp. OR-4]